MIHSSAPRIAWGMWLACATLAAGAIVLDSLRRHSLGSLIDPLYMFFTLLGLTFPTTGALLAARRPENIIGWLLGGFGIVWLGTSTADRYVRLSLTETFDLPATDYVAWLVVWGWFLGLGVVASYVLMLFPDGRLPGPRWRTVAVLDGIWIGLVCIANALRPGPFHDYDSISNPLGVDGAGGFIQMMEFPLYLIGFPLVLGASVSALVVRYRRARSVERLQIRWIVYAGLLVAVSLLAGIAGDELTELGGLQWALLPLALVNLSIFVAIAILRYRLFDIDLVINRTLVYGALTTCIIGIYVGVVGYLGQALHADGNLAISLVATGVVAVLFQPLRVRLQQGVDRLMYGHRDDPYGVIERLGERLGSTLGPEDVLPAIAETIAQTLKLPYASIALRRGETFATAAAWGTPGSQRSTMTLPLVYQSETVGRLELAQRAPNEPFSPADHRILQGIAHQVGIAAHAVQLAADLQRSRERIVIAREEERRRLRRELHDGVGPGLAGLVVRMEAAKNISRQNPDGIEDILDELLVQTRSAIADIRRAVYELRPPALDELGLVSAIREHVVLFGGDQAAPLHISVDAPERIPQLPAAVEVAAYRIAMEALTNVVRHAHASTCVIRISCADQLYIDVCDDGIGLADAARPGIGISSMRERATELRGTLSISPRSGGGTCIHAGLPLPGEPRKEPVDGIDPDRAGR